MSRRAMMIHVGAGGGGGGLSSPVTITIDHTKCGTADTSGFVALFSSTNVKWKSTGNGGEVGTVNDFRFANDNAEAVRCTWEIVSWDQVNGTLVARVNVGTLTHASDLVRYLFWDNTGRGSFLGGSAGAIWDANYKSCYGFGDGTTLSLTDLTTNANNGTNNGTAVAAAGINGVGGISFDSSLSQYISTPNTENIAHPTMEIWFKASVNPGEQKDLCGIVQGNGGGTTDKDLQVGTTGEVRWFVFATGAGTCVSSGGFCDGNWHYAVGLADGTNQTLYVDGALAQNITPVGDTFTGYSGPGFQVNGLFHSGHYWTFTASETRLSNTARSASYILATYNSYNAPSTFYTLS